MYITKIRTLIKFHCTFLWLNGVTAEEKKISLIYKFTKNFYSLADIHKYNGDTTNVATVNMKKQVELRAR